MSCYFRPKIEKIPPFPLSLDLEQYEFLLFLKLKIKPLGYI